MSVVKLFRTGTSSSGLSLEALGNNIYVVFPVRTLSQAKVVWLDEQWFLENGLDIGYARTRKQVEIALLDVFGVEAIGYEEARKSSIGVQKVLFADRYGGSGGAPHGGSGRCGIFGGLNAKGIGPTPLVSGDVDVVHKHGYLWMRDALREAICTKVAGAELVHGAVPVIAIIDTGLDHIRPDANVAERRAIVVRPNFVRLAHFERSIFFGNSGFTGSDQSKDAARTRQAVRAAEQTSEPAPPNMNFIVQAFSNQARQIGSQRALRLWSGRFLSSNAAVTGASVDMGIFRSVPNWCRLLGVPGELFGDDRKLLAAAVLSLCFYFEKYGARTYDFRAMTDVINLVDRIIGEQFIKDALDGLGVCRQDHPDLANELASRLATYFLDQQQISVKANSSKAVDHPWLYNVFVDHPGEIDEAAAATQIRRLLESHNEQPERPKVSLKNAARWLKPRTELYYSELGSRTAEFAERLRSGKGRARAQISRFIDKTISRNRRFWPALPKSFEIQGVVSRGSSTALYGKDLITVANGVWLEGIIIRDEFRIFGASIPISNLPRVVTTGGGVRLLSFHLLPEHYSDNKRELTLGDFRLCLPPAEITY